ncbi:hypothetical protein ACUQ99_09240 [Azospirillum sp. A39]
MAQAWCLFGWCAGLFGRTSGNRNDGTEDRQALVELGESRRVPTPTVSPRRFAERVWQGMTAQDAHTVDESGVYMCGQITGCTMVYVRSGAFGTAGHMPGTTYVSSISQAMVRNIRQHESDPISLVKVYFSSEFGQDTSALTKSQTDFLRFLKGDFGSAAFEIYVFDSHDAQPDLDSTGTPQIKRTAYVGVADPL